jgi:hypothetical protein
MLDQLRRISQPRDPAPIGIAFLRIGEPTLRAVRCDFAIVMFT